MEKPLSKVRQQRAPEPTSGHRSVRLPGSESLQPRLTEIVRKAQQGSWLVVGAAQVAPVAVFQGNTFRNSESLGSGPGLAGKRRRRAVAACSGLRCVVGEWEVCVLVPGEHLRPSVGDNDDCDMA